MQKHSPRFVCLLLLCISARLFAQDTIRTFLPDGKVKELKIVVKGELVQAAEFHEVRVKSTDTIGTMEYSARYRWDKRTKTIESYWSVDEDDSLEEVFFKACPEYTMKQHYGSGPLMYIEHYKNGLRDGDYETYDELGRLTEKGQFANGNKTGVCKYYDENGNVVDYTLILSGNYSEHGISINHTIVPMGLTLFIIIVLSLIITRRSGYKKFYLLYSPVVIGLFVLLFIYASFSKSPMKEGFASAVFVAVVLLILLSFVNLFTTARYKIKPWHSIAYGIAGLLMFLLYCMSYIEMSIAGAMMG
jgi:hypothetical protein